MFGTLSEPESIVITEDEYLDYLAHISQHEIKRVLPDFVEEALAEKSLLFIGFGLQDWNLRILLRSIIDRCTNSRRGNRLEHLATDMRPTRHGAGSPDSAKEYMVKYFNKHEPPIQIEWADIDEFTADLARGWEEFG